jgi:hypothetical protein
MDKYFGVEWNRILKNRILYPKGGSLNEEKAKEIKGGFDFRIYRP